VSRNDLLVDGYEFIHMTFETKFSLLELPKLLADAVTLGPGHVRESAQRRCASLNIVRCEEKIGANRADSLKMSTTSRGHGR
jgi:hypothetical protein